MSLGTNLFPPLSTIEESTQQFNSRKEPQSMGLGTGMFLPPSTIEESAQRFNSFQQQEKERIALSP
ncbi:hypothetical protein [Bacillus thuringiensis]|uniref:hypothetical protein n=1 Tax=Bacillus thuringiensis TaxID=1428 RepID=UPI000CD87179|nr:hypothetical protein [Bacillus thuringiensis]QFQ28850.1 hypothetical protein DDE73_30035 [Bacillus thuringiensis]